MILHIHKFLDTGATLTVGAGSDAKWCKLFPLGVTKFRKDFVGGKLDMDRAFCESIVTNYANEGKPERVVNYNHKQPDAHTPNSETVAAGWITDLALKDDGLYALIKWTDKARAHILADEFKFLSPEFATDCISKHTGKKQGPTLFGAALLNTPFLTELPAVAASEVPNNGAETVDKKKICETLGMPEDSTDEAVMSKMKELCEHSEKSKMAAEASATKLTEFESASVKLSETISALEAEKAAWLTEKATLATEKRAGEVKAFVDGLVKAGKITPAVRENFEAMGNAGGVDAIRFLEKMVPVITPGKEIGVTGEDTPVDPAVGAKVKFNERLAENQKKFGSYERAFKATKDELPAEAALVYVANPKKK